MTTMTKYVLGFLFGPPEKRSGDLIPERPEPKVLLIRKKRPEWQAGLLNGIGGKIEAGEDSFAAMVREFEEETDIKTPTLAWEQFAYLIEAGDSPSWSVACFRSFNEEAWSMALEAYHRSCIGPTDEPLHIRNEGAVHRHPSLYLPNLRWLIPLALDRRPGKSPGMVTVFYPVGSQ